VFGTGWNGSGEFGMLRMIGVSRRGRILVSATLAALALIAGLAAAPQPALAQLGGATGRTVTEVIFSNDGKTALGSFRSLGGGRWVEANQAGQAVFSFLESARDDWSVYLVDNSRSMEIQLDLHTRQVNWNYFGQARQPLYQIIWAQTASAAAPAPAPVAPPPVVVTGWTVKEVVFTSNGSTPLGSYRSVGGGAWVEANAAGQPVFSFVESARDDWSVYLVDNSRGMEIQLDLHTRLVNWNLFGQPRQPLYQVLSAK